MLSRTWLTLIAWLCLVVPASAQITISYTFVNGTVANADELNTDLSQLATAAVNRTGGTMTGTLTSRAVLPSSHNTYDLATNAARYKDGYFQGTVFAATGFSGAAVTITGTGASALDVGGGINAGTGNVGIIDATGKIPALSSTYLADLSGANLTGLSGANVTGAIAPAALAASNIVLLNATNSYTAFGAQSLSAAGTGFQRVVVRNTTAGTGNGSDLLLGNDASATLGLFRSFSSTYTSDTIDLASGVSLEGTGAGGLSIGAIQAGGVLRLYAGGTAIRWGVNAAGDWTVGPSSTLVDSVGTPTCGTNCTTIGGTDYAFTTNIKASGSLVTVNFGHTWSTAPICTGSTTSPAYTVYIGAVSTTAVSYAMTGGGGDQTAYILCRSY